jgi:hypothetical protein
MVRRFAFVISGLHFFFSLVSFVLSAIKDWRRSGVLYEAGGRSGVQGRIVERRPHALHHLLRGTEVDGDKSDAVDQLDDQLFGFGVGPSEWRPWRLIWRRCHHPPASRFQ